MSTVYFDTTNATEIAQFQGTLAGIQAGNASVTGVGTAATSVYNQSGYYALQDTDTGYVTLQKLGNESLFTGSWYDQTTGTTFDFSSTGTTVNSTSSSSSDTDDDDDDSSSGLQSYTFGSGYVVGSSSSSSSSGTSGTSSTSSTTSTSSSSSDSDYVTDEDGNVIEITADQLQEMVDAGIYDNLAEALETTLANGYYVSDETQASLGIYSDEDEERIQLMMSSYGLTREEAISALESGGAISDSTTLTQVEELETMLQEVQDDQGFIGRTWNSFKSSIEDFFGADVGVTSDDCEYAIEQFEAGEITYDEAAAVIEDYSSRQEKATNTIKTGAAVAVGAAAALSPLGLVGTIVAGVVGGAAAKTAVGVADRASDNNDENDGFNSEVLTDAGTGAVAGGIAAAGTTVAKGAVKVAAGVAKTGAKAVTGIGTTIAKIFKK
ncbi:MAG: hypothetical protein LUE64_01085 [Candidatus Gastranaerophilales bacterium]|nr:hypothetical protein [Candidatus Gastranaerophilales bacterium]